MVKEFLRERDVDFQLKDLSKDAKARDEFVRDGYLLPPVVIVDGVAVTGYDPVRLEELLDDSADG